MLLSFVLISIVNVVWFTTSLRIYQQSVVEKNLQLISWIESKKNIMHFKFIATPLPQSVLNTIPFIQHMLPCIAKTGIRTFSASSIGMDTMLQSISSAESNQRRSIILGIENRILQSEGLASQFWQMKNQKIKELSALKETVLPSNERNSGTIPVGLFVYMWVHPNYRKQGIGDVLLQLGQDYCRSKCDEYMLLIHDDNGSGKLIEYYKQRGFVDVFDSLDKGMICSLHE
jgi:GNAT superfamily N-acetyltransferase